MQLPGKYRGPRAALCLKSCLLTSRNTSKVSLVTCNKIIKLQIHGQESSIHAVSFCYPCNVESKEERYFHF